MEGWASAAAYTAAALASAAAATVVALRLVHRHLLHYAEPTHQRFIVRIILMVPVRLPLPPALRDPLLYTTTRRIVAVYVSSLSSSSL
jgi:hypothetical protein